MDPPIGFCSSFFFSNKGSNSFYYYTRSGFERANLLTFIMLETSEHWMDRFGCRGEEVFGGTWSGGWLRLVWNTTTYVTVFICFLCLLLSYLGKIILGECSFFFKVEPNASVTKLSLAFSWSFAIRASISSSVSDVLRAQTQIRAWCTSLPKIRRLSQTPLYFVLSQISDRKYLPYLKKQYHQQDHVTTGSKPLTYQLNS